MQKGVTSVRGLIFTLVSAVLTGCASNSLESRVCDGFQEWVKAPIANNEQEKSVSFDWSIVDEESIPFYANLITDGPADDTDRALYAKAAQATHYIELRKYSSLVASCLSLREDSGGEGKLSYVGKYGGKEVSVVWEPRYCGLDEMDGSGCFTITKR